jgi:hypothetical protein
MSKLVVTFRNFANASKKVESAFWSAIVAATPVAAAAAAAAAAVSSSSSSSSTRRRYYLFSVGNVCNDIGITGCNGACNSKHS